MALDDGFISPQFSLLMFYERKVGIFQMWKTNLTSRPKLIYYIRWFLQGDEDYFIAF